MEKYRKKPVVIEAIQRNGADGNAMDLITWSAGSQTPIDCGDNDQGESQLYVKTLEGKLWITEGDWVIKGVQGEFYPCKSDIFEATYEVVLECPNNQ